MVQKTPKCVAKFGAEALSHCLGLPTGMRIADVRTNPDTKEVEVLLEGIGHPLHLWDPIPIVPPMMILHKGCGHREIVWIDAAQKFLTDEHVADWPASEGWDRKPAQEAPDDKAGTD